MPFLQFHRDIELDKVAEEVLKRVEANDPLSIFMLADSYYQGLNGFQQDHVKALELLTKAANLGCSKAHNNLGVIYEGAGNLKKAKFHVEAAAMAGDEEWHGAILESLRHSPETWNEPGNILLLQHQLGIIVP